MPSFLAACISLGASTLGLAFTDTGNPKYLNTDSRVHWILKSSGIRLAHFSLSLISGWTANILFHILILDCFCLTSLSRMFNASLISLAWISVRGSSMSTIFSIGVSIIAMRFDIVIDGLNTFEALRISRNSSLIANLLFNISTAIKFLIAWISSGSVYSRRGVTISSVLLSTLFNSTREGINLTLILSMSFATIELTTSSVGCVAPFSLRSCPAFLLKASIFCLKPSNCSRFWGNGLSPNIL